MADRFPITVDPELGARYRADGWWSDTTLSQHVTRHAQERPIAAAFVADAGTLSWAGYDEAATRLAGVLAAAGVAAGDRVAVWLPDSATVHVAFVAVERAGGTVVGIGARAGDREVRHLLERTHAGFVVTVADGQGERVAAITGGQARHVVVPRFEARLDGAITVDGAALAPAGHEVLAGRAVGPDDVFLVNSTSGTTGLPKCVLHTQNRWHAFHRQAVANGALSDADVFLGLVPSPFGFGLWTAHVTPTILGATTVVTERFAAGAALDLVERERPTVVACVSTQLVLLLNHEEFARCDLSSLRVMFTGGEAVPFEQAAAFEAATGCTILQFYGSNETGMLSGTTLDDPIDKRLRTAGRVVPAMHVRLFDGDRDVTDRGWGQPAAKGPTTCLGYLDDPEANAQLVRPDGWMLMGDLCTIDADGYLTVTGRVSDLIIRGGKNISAPQVEEEAMTHAAVALAAAVAEPDPVFGERVCLYVELRPGCALTLDELRAHLDQRGTSKELHPERLVVLDALPRSSGGKVAKGELRADAEQRASGGSYRPVT